MLRPQLAAGFTIIPGAPGDEVVWLIAGEDVRIALRGDAVNEWLPAVLHACDGSRALGEIVALAPPARRAEARTLLDGLAGERVVVEAGALRAHRPQPIVWRVDGSGALADALRARAPSAGDPASARLTVIAQDTLELASVLARNRTQLAAGERWLWATIGPAARALVSPVFLPDAGPCFECMIGHFALQSPVPELYERIALHRGPFASAELAPEAIALVGAVVAAKLARLADPLAPSALYVLHVVELAALEVASHRVWINPECPACATRGS